RRVELSALPGWAAEDHNAAFAAWRATCGVVREARMADLCARARSISEVAPGDGRRFLERAFVAERVGGEGVLTAYFAPVSQARMSSSAEFRAAVRPRPAALVVTQGGEVLQVKPDASAEPY